MLDYGFYNMDCMEGMKQFPDKFFDLAVVDPPYGDGSKLSDNSGGYWNRFGGRFDRYKNAQTWERGEMEQSERAGLGPRSSKKNHNVGRGAV